jgi:hypothetical protein
MSPHPNEFLLQAFRFEQLGLYSRALEEYRKALDAQPQNVTAANRYFRLLRDMRPEAPEELKLIWQVDYGTASESDWVRFLLSGLDYAEIADGQHRELHDGAIIVDSHIGSQRRPYYFEMLQRGNRFALIHLSDEHYGDDASVYNSANLVLRHYWSRVHASDRCVIGIPLGVMNGFKVEMSPSTVERRFVWSFAGNTQKHSRVQMLQAMSAVEGGRVHATSAVNPRSLTPEHRGAADALLSIEDYAQLLSDTIFAPCPAGWENLDSFRVCEALEAGCIPIVERRPFYDYFRHLFGDHPMLSVSNWSEAPALIASLRKDRGALDRRRIACARWWHDHKSTLVVTIRDRILRSFMATV